MSALRDANGVLATARDRIEEIVLQELEKIFSGHRSKIFSHRNEQLVKEVAAAAGKGWRDWVPDSVDPCKFEDVVCRPVSEREVEKVIAGLKMNRAPGVDGVTSSMLKLAGPLFISMFTDLVNTAFKEGQVPESLAVGKMTLIDKKAPSLFVKDKRPLTVSSVLLSVITKILHGRLDPICEAEGYYGAVQYGFRKNLSMSDCVFILLAAIRRAKRKGQTISFCDIAKAYDSVDRELLYLKLDSLGFGGRVKALIQSMYYNDCVQVRIRGGLSAPLWFTKGVKQGCVLSPLLFALYISSLGNFLHSLQEGVNFDGLVVSALFFADDLVLISPTRRRGMERMFRAVQRFCAGMHMRLAVSKTIILTNGPEDSSWLVSEDEPELEALLVGKYLGVDIQVKGRNLVKARMLAVARSYAHTIIGLTRSGLNRALIAIKLWECCAVPAILYGAKAMTVTAATLAGLERIQGQVARFILQLPSSASGVAGFLDAGLKPMCERIKERLGLYVWSIVNKRRDPILTGVFASVMRAGEDPWARSVQGLDPLSTGLVLKPKSVVRRTLLQAAIRTVVAKKREHTSLRYMPLPIRWFKLQPHVSDTQLSRLLCRIRAGDAGLGNRRPSEFGKSYKLCPYCLQNGTAVALNEAHAILECPASGYARRVSGLKAYIDAYSHGGAYLQSRVLRAYLGGDGVDVQALSQRAASLEQVLESWFQQVSTL